MEYQYVVPLNAGQSVEGLTFYNRLRSTCLDCQGMGIEGPHYTFVHAPRALNLNVQNDPSLLENEKIRTFDPSASKRCKQCLGSGLTVSREDWETAYAILRAIDAPWAQGIAENIQHVFSNEHLRFNASSGGVSTYAMVMVYYRGIAAALTGGR